METLHPKSGFASQPSLSGHETPATPPYTPAKHHKRRFERSDSPASSIHPAETSSPAKKILKRTASDGIVVIELPDSDLGLFEDAETVSPAELEEVEDYLSVGQDDSEDSDSDSGISSRFERLDCNEREEEIEMTKKRKDRRLSKRTGSRLFKRAHSQTAVSDTEVTDPDGSNDRSGDTNFRRLRRRVEGPVEGSVGSEGWISSPEPGDSLASAKAPSSLLGEEHQGPDPGVSVDDGQMDL